jgi:two-component system OmpR family response regulator/two-component system response regulator CpxR
LSRILLIDDDVELLDLLANYLTGEGFDVTSLADPVAGVAAARSGEHQLVVLDVMMPRLNGFEALRRIRSASRVPVLMLTARGDDTDRIVGLELGADDYVPKPCTPRELTARVRAILRRTEPVDDEATPAVIEAGPLKVFPRQRRAELSGTALELTSTEFNLLEVLARHSGRPVGKGELSQHALGRPLARFDRSIDVHVSNLRRKLGTRPDGRSWIETVLRQGYQWIGG